MWRIGIIVLLGSLSLWSRPALSDQFHYANVLMGDRAMGLGGAFTAVADDASGLVYNPAGIAFSLSNDISGSVNGFYNRRIVYKDTLGDADFEEKSQGSVSPFFGALQKMDSMAPGLAVAFGLFTRDSELKDQDDHIVDSTIGIQRFHRTTNIRAETKGYGLAVAKRLLSNFALGMSLSYLTTQELKQEYQDANTVAGTQVNIVAENLRELLEASALELGLGFQVSLSPQFAFGMNIKVPTVLGQSFEQGVERTTLAHSANDDITGDGVRVEAQRTIVDQGKVDNPIGTWPSEYRAGLAWFASTELLMAFDVSHFTAAKGEGTLYERLAVTNFALGMEYYITAQLPLRMGYFTNNDSRPEVKEGESGQPDHIDYTGYSVFLGWVQPNSQIAFGGILQQGAGKAQKLGDTTIQDVEAYSNTFALSASHNF